jgi:YHS domain-containing protein
MSIHSLRLAIAFTATFVPGVATAQHEAPQADAGQRSPEMVQCARVQPVIDSIIAAAMARVESARLSNNPAEMRTAIDHLEAALRDIRAQLEPCSTAAAASDPHAGHTMPGMTQAPGAPAAGASMDRSKMPMGGTPSAKPEAAAGAKPATPAAPIEHSKMPMGGTPPAKPGAAAGAKPAAPAAPMDHSKMPMGGKAQPGKVMDPVNGLMVDPATAPKTTHQGQTYYFSSEQTRKEFLENPAKFAKKPRG